MNEALAQQILDLIYHDPEVRRRHKDSLANWILDTQPRTAPVDTAALLEYLSVHQPNLLHRLRINVRIKDELAHALASLEPTRAGSPRPL